MTIIDFKELGSRKLLKQLYLGVKPNIGETVIVNEKEYTVKSVVFYADKPSYTIWLKKDTAYVAH